MFRHVARTRPEGHAPSRDRDASTALANEPEPASIDGIGLQAHAASMEFNAAVILSPRLGAIASSLYNPARQVSLVNDAWRARERAWLLAEESHTVHD